MSRTAEIRRTTRETDIKCTFSIDGSGSGERDTGIGFFDHMLDGFARHGLFDLNMECQGDTFVDGHHTVEDCGIVLGEAIKQALGDKAGIRRFGHSFVPMDDALVLCAVDLSGRPYLAWDAAFTADSIGSMDTQLAKEFFYAVSYSAGMNIHVKVISGENDHHIMEAMFKAFARALDMATVTDPRIEGVLSTKGSL
ncbi:MAG: imidazoleglycerol-phosphate dehydratase HisB [Lachnospiraceae bacterium]|nr:imidazoleglycerol-phosphate dehydratase HisB [Lachnospiraceae bacterium]